MATLIGDTLPWSVLDLFALGDAAEGQCVPLITVDPDGTPRPCLLSVGEIAIVDAHVIRLLTWPDSRTTANLRGGGTALITVTAAPEVFHIRATPRQLPAAPDCDLARFALSVVSVEADAHDGLPVTQPMWFSARTDLAADVLAMWRAQHRALRV